MTINGIPAHLYFVSLEQVNAFAPLQVAPGPGIFTINGQGTGDGVLASVLAPGFVGLYQVNAQLPANLAVGFTS